MESISLDLRKELPVSKNTVKWYYSELLKNNEIFTLDVYHIAIKNCITEGDLLKNHKKPAANYVFVQVFAYEKSQSSDGDPINDYLLGCRTCDKFGRKRITDDGLAAVKGLMDDCKEKASRDSCLLS